MIPPLKLRKCPLVIVMLSIPDGVPWMICSAEIMKSSNNDLKFKIQNLEFLLLTGLSEPNSSYEDSSCIDKGTSRLSK